MMSVPCVFKPQMIAIRREVISTFGDWLNLRMMILYRPQRTLGPKHTQAFYYSQTNL